VRRRLSLSLQVDTADESYRVEKRKKRDKKKKRKRDRRERETPVVDRRVTRRRSKLVNEEETPQGEGEDEGEAGDERH
jgi:hypothetical protein